MLQHLHDCFFFPYIFVFLTFTMGGYESEHEHSIEVPRHGIAIPGVFFLSGKVPWSVCILKSIGSE